MPRPARAGYVPDHPFEPQQEQRSAHCTHIIDTDADGWPIRCELPDARHHIHQHLSTVLRPLEPLDGP